MVTYSDEELAALIREAEARGMERAAEICDALETRSNRPARCAADIRAEAAALRGETEPK